MSYVCDQITEIEGSHVCSKWVELNLNTGFLPELTSQQRDEIIIWMVSIFAVVYVVKRLRRFLGA